MSAVLFVSPPFGTAHRKGGRSSVLLSRRQQDAGRRSRATVASIAPEKAPVNRPLLDCSGSQRVFGEARGLCWAVLAILPCRRHRLDRNATAAMCPIYQPRSHQTESKAASRHQHIPCGPGNIPKAHLQADGHQ